MIKKIYLISFLLIPLISATVYGDKARTKNIFIKPFTVYTGGASFDFTDYMSEVIVEYKEFNLISDEEIGNQQEAVERKMAAEKNNDEDAVREIMKMVDSDFIIYGSVSKGEEGGFTISAVLLDRSGGSVRKTLTIKRDRYFDSAARSIAHYLLTRDESFIKKFQKEMKNKEEDIARDENERMVLLTGVESSFIVQNATIQNSPFIRLGYGGLSGSSSFSNKKLNDYYPEGRSFTGDIFLYRSRDYVGDGVDIYSRLSYRKYKADSGAYSKISGDMAASGAGSYNDIAGKYNPVPMSDLMMVQRGADLGFRFAGTTYFFNEAWSFYMMFGGRYMQITESYKGSDGLEYKKKLSGFGGTGGVGMEVTLNRYLGLFAEVNAGYVPVGENKLNYDGVQLILGVTFRSNHIDGPVLGFL